MQIIASVFFQSQSHWARGCFVFIPFKKVKVHSQPVKFCLCICFPACTVEPSSKKVLPKIKNRLCLDWLKYPFCTYLVHHSLYIDWQFAVCHFLVNLKQGQGKQICYQSVDPKQGYNCAKCEGPHINRVWEKANIKFFFKSGNRSNIFL